MIIGDVQMSEVKVGVRVLVKNGGELSIPVKDYATGTVVRLDTDATIKVIFDRKYITVEAAYGKEFFVSDGYYSLIDSFKEGDVVFVEHRVEEEEDWDNSWVDNMDEYIGTTRLVKYVSSAGVTLYSNRDSVGYDFPFSSLTMVQTTQDEDSPTDGGNKQNNHIGWLESKLAEVEDEMEKMFIDIDFLQDIRMHISGVIDYLKQ